GVSPNGKPWAPLKSRDGNPLRDTSRLQNSFVPSTTQSGFEITSTNVQYATLHQFGGTITPKRARVLAFKVRGQQVFARKVTIPARPFIPTRGLSSTWAARFRAAAQKAFENFLK